VGGGVWYGMCEMDVLLGNEGIGGLHLSYCCAIHGIYGVPLLPLPTVAGGRESAWEEDGDVLLIREREGGG
jgi:hypothetical protein